MTPDLWKAATFAVAVHAGLLCAGWSARPVLADVERGFAGLDVELLSPAQLPVSETPQPIAEPTRHDDSWLHEDGHGATTEAKPQAVHNRPPAYPWLAWLQGWEGMVMLRVRVKPDGRPAQVRVVSSSGHAMLDDAAQQAVSRWEFLPATRGGHAVVSTVDVPVRFRLMETRQ